MTSNVIPLPFKGDLIDFLKLYGREIAWLWRDGKAYIPVKPICEILGLAWPPQYRRIMEMEDASTVTLTITVGGENAPSATQKMKAVGADGKQREMLCLAYPDFMAWLFTITPSRVKSEAREAVRATRREIKLLIANYHHERMFGEIAEYSVALQKLKMDATHRKPLRGRVVDAVGYGWDFETLWRSSSTSRPKWVSVIRDCLALGLIDAAPRGTPFEQFQLKVAANDDSQLEMFGHA